MCRFRRGDGRFLGLLRVDHPTGRLSLIDRCGPGSHMKKRDNVRAG